MDKGVILRDCEGEDPNILYETIWNGGIHWEWGYLHRPGSCRLFVKFDYEGEDLYGDAGLVDNPGEIMDRLYRVAKLESRNFAKELEVGFYDRINNGHPGGERAPYFLEKNKGIKNGLIT
tara:strand:+ start:286 stop:645 length:360 start_codon:yes stop_codon:yes gene_type:complete